MLPRLSHYNRDLHALQPQKRKSFSNETTFFPKSLTIPSWRESRIQTRSNKPIGWATAEGMAFLGLLAQPRYDSRRNLSLFVGEEGLSFDVLPGILRGIAQVIESFNFC